MWFVLMPPVIKLLGYVQVLQVVVYGPLILLQKRVGVSQAVTGLSLHHLVSQLPRQLQSLPRERGTYRYVKNMFWVTVGVYVV